jgi:hypothetical protein
MIRFSIALVIAVAAVCSAGGGAAGQGERPEKPPILFTQSDFDRPVKVKNNDVIEVRLPATLAMKWVLTQEQPILRPVDRATRPNDEPKAAPTPKNPFPTLGPPGNWDQLYEISSSRAANIRPTWIYCRFGKPEMTKKRIEEKVIPQPVPPEFRPNLKRTDLREGMTFQIILQVVP